jgi:hypothetical protein
MKVALDEVSHPSHVSQVAGKADCPGSSVDQSPVSQASQSALSVTLDAASHQQVADSVTDVTADSKEQIAGSVSSEMKGQSVDVEDQMEAKKLVPVKGKI